MPKLQELYLGSFDTVNVLRQVTDNVHLRALWYTCPGLDDLEWNGVRWPTIEHVNVSSCSFDFEDPFASPDQSFA
jgi:hypothetical protein